MTVNGRLSKATVQLSGGMGSAALGTRSLDVSQGIYATGFAGTVNIVEATTETDRIQLTGAAEQFVELVTTPTSNNIYPYQPANFQINVLSNITDSYTLDVSGPEGWQIALDKTGLVTVTPGLNIAQPTDYTFLVTAASLSRPDMVVQAQHMVTIQAHQGMNLTVTEDP